MTSQYIVPTLEITCKSNHPTQPEGQPIRMEEGVCHRSHPPSSSIANIDFGFDSILGQLDDLERQFELEHEKEILNNSNCTNNTNRNISKTSNALNEFSLINSQLQDVLNDLAGFGTGPDAPSFADADDDFPEPPKTINRSASLAISKPNQPREPATAHQFTKQSSTQELTFSLPTPPLKPTITTQQQHLTTHQQCTTQQQLPLPTPPTKSKVPPPTPAKNKSVTIQNNLTIINNDKSSISNINKLNITNNDYNEKHNDDDKINKNNNVRQTIPTNCNSDNIFYGTNQLPSHDMKSNIVKRINNNNNYILPNNINNNNNMPYNNTAFCNNTNIYAISNPNVVAKNIINNDVNYIHNNTNSSCSNKAALNNNIRNNTNNNLYNDPTNNNNMTNINAIYNNNNTISDNAYVNNNNFINNNNSNNNNMSLQQTGYDSSTSPKKSSMKKDPVQACVKVMALDGSEKILFVTSETTVGQLCDNLVADHITAPRSSFSLWEVIPDLHLERCLDECLLILNDVVDCWTKHSTNTVAMKPAQIKMLPTLLKNDLESNLYAKVDDKKTWKNFLFLVKHPGLLYYPKGKGKSEATLYCELNPQNHVVYQCANAKKKLKAPTEFGFALKTSNSNTTKDVRYFCTETEALYNIWLHALKTLLAKKTSEMDYDCDAAPSLQCVSTPTVMNNLVGNSNICNSVSSYEEHKPAETSITTPDAPANLYVSDANVYSEPYELSQINTLRRFSNTSSSCRPDIAESLVSPSIKKTAVLPISTETTRLLQSMQNTNILKNGNVLKTLPKPVNKDLLKQTTIENHVRIQANQNDYTPSPTHMKSPEHHPMSNVIKTLPKPTKSNYTKTQMCQEDDLPPPPLSILNRNQNDESFRQYQTISSVHKSRNLPPPPPKRDQNTKLSNIQTADCSIQTKNFILNLDRTIGMKKCFGAEGLCKMEMPLPPPPVVSNELSYIDLGELPPPPAELLQGLKKMRNNPSFYHVANNYN
ncbi:hypothetical protein HELRODRAFT_191344 [Helobdella robusta]|uniref:PH domain-containing protein n=1 Tax=Helobdella robusta TaxID=6412 RepID=T1FSW8_HELRO|nr:hypothetical protein HELRODRAFT_191344 [Helobdella robusta]ESO05614.1 hypothetical protein HELRODRAFT_191344 [Helobdella robusta]